MICITKEVNYLKIKNVIIRDTKFNKLDKASQRTIKKGIEKLELRLAQYGNDIKIETIFDDDILIHDIVNKKFYVYKCTIGKVQLRLLYTIKNDDLYIISHYFKKSSNKEWISYFENVADSFDIEI